MNTWSILAWNAATLMLSASYWYWTVPKNLPPGSAGLPILGYLPFLDRESYVTMTKLKKKYGNLFYLYLGSKLVIVLNDFESVKQALLKQGDVFAGRSPTAEFDEVVGDFSGVIMTEGEHWKQHRRFILRNLRDNGVGKLTLEPLILNEIQHFLAAVKNHDSKGPFELKDHLFSSMTNNIHILVGGKRYEYDQPEIRRIIQIFKDFEKLTEGAHVETFFPWIKSMLQFIKSKQLQKIRALKLEFMDIFVNTINEAKSKMSTDDQNENYIQAYVNEAKTNKQIFTDHGLLHNTRDLLIAGSDTSATTLTWAALYMAKYPEIQKNVQNEIERVIGQREVSYNDRMNTPYTEATICEIHRTVSLAPISIPHRVMHDTTLYGYNIPQDAMVIPNIWAVHNDEKLWGDPHNFRPERFIGPDGDCVKPEYLIPFSIGKRACAGEPLARMELYLYFVSLLQNFTFHPPEGGEITFDSSPGLTRQPKCRFICVKSRQ